MENSYLFLYCDIIIYNFMYELIILEEETYIFVGQNNFTLIRGSFFQCFQHCELNIQLIFIF